MPWLRRLDRPNSAHNIPTEDLPTLSQKSISLVALACSASLIQISAYYSIISLSLPFSFFHLWFISRSSPISQSPFFKAIKLEPQHYPISSTTNHPYLIPPTSGQDASQSSSKRNHSVFRSWSNSWIKSYDSYVIDAQNCTQLSFPNHFGGI